MSPLLTVHTQYAAPEVLDAGHRLLLLEVHHPEDAVVGAAGHEVVPAEVLDTGEVGALPLWLNVSNDLTTAIVQDLDTVLSTPCRGLIPGIALSVL